MFKRIVLLLSLLISVSFVPSAFGQDDQRCFPETGQCISGRMREFWEQNGGLTVFGYPTTDLHAEEIEGKLVLVQWFERNRLELHPENQRPFDVLLGRLGVDRLAQQGIDWFSFPKGQPQDGCRYFSETQHKICGDFLNYFRSHGLDLGQADVSEGESLALFGMPISEATFESNPSDGQIYLIQHFERARFELHPEIGPNVVLLGLLGNEIRQAQAEAEAAPVVEEPAAPPPPPIQPQEVLDGYRKKMPNGYWTVSQDGLRISASGFQYVPKIKYSEAGDGYKYVVFNLEFVNDGYTGRSGNTAAFANTASFSLIDLDNRVHDIASATFSLDDYLDGGTVYQGTKVSGQLAFRIAKDSAPAIIVYDTTTLIHLDLRVAPHTQ
jgi:hypothetical protein